MIRRYQIAGINVEINSVYSAIHELCCEYASEEEPEIYIQTNIEDIQRNRKKAQEAWEKAGRQEKHFEDDYVETFTVYRKLAEVLPNWNTFMLHASVVSVDNFCYAFTAQSGTGKSTHTALWRSLLKSRAIMVNDDKPLIRVEEDGSAIAFGTPWNGKHGLGNNIAVPLRAICILERSETNRIDLIDKQEAYPMLLQQVCRPLDKERLIRLLSLIDRMNVQFYRMGCNMDISAAKIAYKAMSGDCLNTGNAEDLNE